jgi:phosphoglycerol transferase MdoB-like AlkP superfamily enzyme
MFFRTPKLNIQASVYSNVIAFVWNITLVYLLYALCRLVYLFENWDVLSAGFSQLNFYEALTGSLKFDTVAIAYTNALYALFMLFPLRFREAERWRKMCKYIFVIVNAVCIVINLTDSVYFQYTGRRTTFSVFGEFGNENNLGRIFGEELLNHWYIVLIGLVLIAALWIFYLNPKGKPELTDKAKRLKYYIFNIFCFILYIPLTVIGMRGGCTTGIRPITISNANQYVNRPAEAALILNTPFSMIRTIGKNVFSDPGFFSKQQLDKLYSPVHIPQPEQALRKKNVVILIVESFGREYIGAYNEKLENGRYKGYTPFIDSLLSRSLSFDYTFCNGRKSIDGMPSILSGIPCFREPFVLTPSSMNKVSGIAGELAKKGYYSAFFHGAENSSMGFQAFAKATGFNDYFGKTEYEKDKRFGGKKDFDGTWAIWDESFLQFFALKMSDFKQPFVTSVFTASSHHPYKVPDKYKKVFVDDGKNVIHKCIRYTDYSLRRFFETARRQPWFKNTVFVFTSDHTNLADHAEYKTDLGIFGAPIFFYDPSGDIRPQRRHCIAQQTDIMPTVLGYLGYDRPFVAFGQDLFSTDDADTWAVNNQNGVYQYVKGDYVIQLTDEGSMKAVYNYKKDALMKHNLIGKKIPEAAEMEKELKAVIQSYMQRMINDQLIWEN